MYDTDGKPILSPSAIADDEYVASLAKDLAANEWTPPVPAATAPSPPPRSKFVTQREIGRLMERAGHAVREALEPLQKKIGELEQRIGQMKYHGPWQAKRTYVTGSFVTSDGSVWHANEDTFSRPGTDATWTLACKRGRDGKSVK